jgi:hypothetical protein
MDLNQLENLGEELRSVGHKRRQLVEQIVEEVMKGTLKRLRIYIENLLISLIKRLKSLIVKNN